MPQKLRWCYYVAPGDAADDSLTLVYARQSPGKPWNVSIARASIRDLETSTATRSVQHLTLDYGKVKSTWLSKSLNGPDSDKELWRWEIVDHPNEKLIGTRELVTIGPIFRDLVKCEAFQQAAMKAELKLDRISSMTPSQLERFNTIFDAAESANRRKTGHATTVDGLVRRARLIRVNN
ncbi:MAG: hypothetical protein AAGJ46_10105 [Planctomycetota bacterium]